MGAPDPVGLRGGGSVCVCEVVQQKVGLKPDLEEGPWWGWQAEGCLGGTPGGEGSVDSNSVVNRI